MITRGMMDTTYHCQFMQHLRHLWKVLTNLRTGDAGGDAAKGASDFRPRLGLHVESVNVTHSTPRKHHNYITCLPEGARHVALVA